MRRSWMAVSITLGFTLSGVGWAQTPVATPPPAAPVRPAPAAPVQVQETTVPGLAAHGARATTEINAPFDVVAGVVTDFANYREFLPQVRQSRVIARRANQQDVYFQVPLLDNFGTVWMLDRFDVRRTPNSVVVDGHMVNGNMSRFDCRIEAAEIPGTRRTRVAVQMLAVPTFPVPASFLTMQHSRWTGRGLEAIRDRAERLAGLAAISSSRPASNVSPAATTRRPGGSGGGPASGTP
jgi:hypothetical protein